MLAPLEDRRMQGSERRSRPGVRGRRASACLNKGEEVTMGLRFGFHRGG
jgi:hypothetical protein